MRSRWVPAVTLAALTLVVIGPVHAGSKGRRNTAAALGAAAAYEALQGRGTNALMLGAGAAGAYGRYRDARNEEEYRYYDRYDRRDRRYGRNDDRGYKGARDRGRRYEADDDCDRRGSRDDRGRPQYQRGRASRGGYYLDRD